MKRNVIVLLLALLGLSWFSALSEAVNNPKELKAHLERAAELEEKGIYVDAVAEYESALEYDPDNEVIQVKRAQASLNSGDSRSFISICEKTAETYPDNTDALDLLIKYYVENDDEDRAVQYLQKFTTLYPDNQNAQKWFLELKGTYTELYCGYTELGAIVNDTMVVLDGTLYGIADATGRELIPGEYEELAPFSEEGFALARKTDGTWIYIDGDGQTRKVPDESCTDLGMFNEDRAAAAIDGKFGYLDEDMEEAGAFIWDALTAVKEGTGAGQLSGSWVLVDKDGEIKSDTRYEEVVADANGFCSNQKRIFVKKDGAYYIVDTKGKKIGELSFEGAKAFTTNGYAAVCKGGKWGFVDKDGKLVIDYAYEDAGSFQNGFAPVCLDGKWGYIDEEGNLIIKAEFAEATHFSSEGTAVVKVLEQGEEKWRLIQLNLFQ